MTKKVLDILPPEKSKKSRLLLREKKPKLRIPSPRIEPKRCLIFVPLILILAIAFCFKISKAEIKIWPETEAVDFETELTIDSEAESLDFENNILPGEIFEIEKTFSGEFFSSGKALKKAEGVIRLYNAYTTSPEIWLAGTRFVSTEGKLFRSKDKINVPGAKIKNGKIEPSSIDVPVIAAEGGEDYNIDPSHFSVVAYRGTSRYTKYYGESFQPMTGGGQVFQVTKDDLERAENTLTEKAETEVIAALSNSIPSEFIFLEDATDVVILEKSSLSQLGAEVEKFTSQVRAKSSAITFKRENIENFTEEYILSRVSEGQLVYKESLRIDYLIESINFELGTISISLDFSARIYPGIDLEALKEGLSGRSLVETEIFLRNQPQIIKTEVRFWPFWVKSVPKNIEKIEVSYPLIE